MHIISKKKLINFWTRHPQSKNALLAWYRIVDKSAFLDWHQLRRVFPSADKVGGKTVFNIGGHKLRLIAVIHFDRQKLYIRHVLKHADYDKGNWQDD